jgi:hypothetical protein
VTRSIARVRPRAAFVRAWTCALAFTAAFARAGSALAEPEADASEPVARSRVVVGTVIGDAPYDRPELQDVLAAAFASTAMSAEVKPLSGTDDLLARMQWAETSAEAGVRAVFWVEPVDVQTHRLFLFDPTSRRTWVRELPKSDDSDALLESLGIMIGLLAAGLDEGPPRGMQQAVLPTAPEPEPEPEPAPVVAPPPSEPAPAEPTTPAPPRVRWVVGAEYVGGNLDAEVPWHNGVGLRVGVETPIGVIARLRPAVLVPARAEVSPRLSILRVPIALEAGYRFRRDARLQPEIGVAMVVEVFDWSADDEPGLTARSGRTARVGLGPQAGLDARVWRGLGLHLHARADIWLRNVDLVVQESAAREARLSPHPVGAVLQAGMHYAF